MSTCPSSSDTLADWLTYFEQIHHKPIDMGLDRVREVAARMGLQANATVITVAGTNGKGSTCAMLESILLQAGYQVGMYTSPHLLDFNERARVSGELASDQVLVEAFAAVEAARQSTSLTYFEITTLAIMHLFQTRQLDVWILEVGLGGRLDAVNIIDADCAILTSVDLDHMEFLGPDRESIGREKAGVFRPDRPAIVSDPQPPQSVIDHAESIGADLWLFRRDFNYSGDKQQWGYGGRSQRRNALAYPALRGANQLLNSSAALAALEALRDRLAVPAQAIRQGLLLVDWPGRFQVLAGRPTIVLDVAHNPHAAGHLHQNLDNMGFFPYTHAVFGMLADKDVDGVIERLKDRIDHWHLVSTPGPRGLSAEALSKALQKQGIEAPAFDWAAAAKARTAGGIAKQPPEKSIQLYETIAQAYDVAASGADANDRIVVFGSFLTVSAVMQHRTSQRQAARTTSPQDSR